MNEEMLARLQEENQKSKEIEQRMEIVNQQLLELEKFYESLEALGKMKGKEILSSIGKGVYANTEIKEEELFVEVGAGVIVKKSIEETKKVIEEQRARMIEIKMQLSMENEEINSRLRNLINEIQGNS